MKSYIKNIQLLLVFMVLAVIYSGCEKDPEIKIYTYPAPVPTGFSPASGYPGTLITIDGSDFGDYPNAVKVFFGGVISPQIISCVDNQIVAEVPAGAVTGKVTLQVWTNIVDSMGTYTVLPASIVSKVSSTTGNPGFEVTLTGQNFGSNKDVVQVTIGDVVAEIVSFSDTEIKFIVPDTESGMIMLQVGPQEIEVAFYLIGIEKLSGTIIGHEGSWGDNSATYKEAAFDGDIATFVDGANKMGFAGYDLGIDVTGNLTLARYVPRTSHPQRMVGGEIRGSNDPNLSTYTTLYTIEEEPPTGVYTEVQIQSDESFRYIYYHSETGNCNIAELELFGVVTVNPDITSLVFSNTGNIVDDNTGGGFVRGDGGDSRYGVLAEPWISNAATLNKDGVGGYAKEPWNGTPGYMNWETWGNTPVVDGIIYQPSSQALPAGNYTVSFSEYSEIQTNSSVYMVVAAGGDGIPVLADLNTALGSVALYNGAEVGKVTPNVSDVRSFDFTLDAPQVVSLGILGNLEGRETQGNYFIIRWIKIEKN